MKGLNVHDETLKHSYSIVKVKTVYRGEAFNYGEGNIPAGRLRFSASPLLVVVYRVTCLLLE